MEASFFSKNQNGSLSWQVGFGEFLLVVLVLSVESLGVVPEGNESQYVTQIYKAWHTEMFANDLCYDRPCAHGLFFYATCWLGAFMSLTQIAWTLRIVSTLLLAYGWQSLSWSLVPRRYFAVFSAFLLVFFHSVTSIAGEWIWGTAEAKPFAYAFVLLALASGVRERWNRMWIFLGLASMCHILVGGWSVVALFVAWVVSRGSISLSLRRSWRGMLIGGAIALPTFLSVASINYGSLESICHAANVIYLERVPHHLILSSGDYISLAVFAVALFCTLYRSLFDNSKNLLFYWGVGTLFIAFMGQILYIGYLFAPDSFVGLLRFYWYRISSGGFLILMPIIVLEGLRRLRIDMPRVGNICTAALILVAGACIWEEGFKNIYATCTSTPDDEDPQEYADWVEACDWVEKSVPPDAIVLAPVEEPTFAWHACRPCVANWKDLPIRAVDIVEWHRRMRYICQSERVREAIKKSERGEIDILERIPREKILDVCHEFKADYILAESDAPWDFPPVFENKSYKVFAVSQQY
ncbi:MAG: hypothetical protein Q4D38_10870 [Planctomycetia bacterium]|nr:hypothetical protein [Planctomycetia bacterium]